jgi:hypothetical protein
MLNSSQCKLSRTLMVLFLLLRKKKRKIDEYDMRMSAAGVMIVK